MKYLTTRMCLGLFTVLILISCDRKAEEPILTPLKESGISGEAVWNRITVDSNYQKYSEWPVDSGLQPGQSPHGVWHRVFVNGTLFESLPIADSVAPEGAMIVKENFDSGKNLGSLTVMTKVKGFNPDNGDWYWAMFEPDGTVLTEGSPDGCISCHEGMRSNDFVIINALNSAP